MQIPIGLPGTAHFAPLTLCISLCLTACAPGQAATPSIPATASAHASPSVPIPMAQAPVNGAGSEPAASNLYKTFGLGEVSNPQDYFVLPNIEKTANHGITYDRIVTVLTWAGCDSQNRPWARINFYNPDARDEAHRFLHDKPIWLPGSKRVALFYRAGLAGNLIPLAVDNIPAGVGLQFYLTEKGLAQLEDAAPAVLMAVAPNMYSLKDIPKFRAAMATPNAK